MLLCLRIHCSHGLSDPDPDPAEAHDDGAVAAAVHRCHPRSRCQGPRHAGTGQAGQIGRDCRLPGCGEHRRTDVRGLNLHMHLA